MARTLVVTNDYPPRPGGIQAFVQAMVDGFTPSDVVVYASTWRGNAEECRRYDADHPYLTIRDQTTMLIPDPKRVRRAVEIARAEGCDRVWFGAAAPLALMAPTLRRKAGVERLVATTHGHEAGWAQLPGSRQLLRRIGDGVDVLTYLVEYYHRKVGDVLSPEARARMAQLHPGVDIETFHPGVRTEPETLELRKRLGLADRPTVVVAVNDAGRARGLTAGALVLVAAGALGGRGGGKDDVAQGGGAPLGDGAAQAIQGAFDAVRAAIADIMGSGSVR